jgi:surfeit locus 1 family protein
MWSVALRPRWIAALVLALGIAAAFAALGQWQLERSVATGDIVTRETETVVPLDSISEPQKEVRAASEGQLVEATGTVRPDDYILLSDRLNGGEPGYWVTGRMTTDGASLLVGLGWAADEAAAASVLQRLQGEDPTEVTITGRYVAGDAPQETDYENGELNSLSPATMVNLWDELDPRGTYNGYVVVTDSVAGLEQIDAAPPRSDTEISWLNIFYALEWAVFAGFAIFLWWRLVKDAWEAEQAERASIEPPVN